MNMRQRLVFITGIILFLAGCIASLYLFAMVFNAQLYGIFLGIHTESPTQEFRDLRCPLVVSKNETIPIAVSIFNPTTQNLDYRIWIEPQGFVVRSPEKELRITAPRNVSIGLRQLVSEFTEAAPPCRPLVGAD
jgi:hypothetical protein